MHFEIYHLGFLLLSITYLCDCNQISCNNSCGNLSHIQYPFHLQECPPNSFTEDHREFELECSNGTLFFPLHGSKQRYRVIALKPNGLLIDPLLDSDCHIANLKTFNLISYKRLAISSLNYIQLFNCSGRVPPKTINCSIPSPTEQLQNCSHLQADGCLSSWGYKKNFASVDCLSFTSWMLDTDPDLSYKAEYGLKLDWAVRGSCNNEACSANAKCSSNSSLGHNCICKDGFRGDGYDQGLACTVGMIPLNCFHLFPVTDSSLPQFRCYELCSFFIFVFLKSGKTLILHLPTVLPLCNATLKTNCICEDVNANGSCSHGMNDLEKALKAAVGALAAATFFAVLAIAWVMKKKKGSFFPEKQDMSKQQLESLLLTNKGSVKTVCFSYKELEKCTKYFSPNRKLGNGGFGTVYAARLSDGRLAAVKRIHFLSPQGFQQVVNEVNVLSAVEHKNLVRLLGCCFEKVDPLIVFEYVPNGTLSEHLQRERGEGLDWFMRITIATATAEALAYLHSMNPPVYHRDVKSANILLDYDFNVKIADFGLSRLALDCTEGSHVSTMPQGTPGYIDPDYHRSYHLSDKSDVYSFGVVLIEIITALKPVDFSREKKEVNLAALAVAKIGNGSLDDIIDPFLQAARNPAIRAVVQSVAELAFRCLSFDKEARPTMLEVLEELNLIKNTSAPLQDLSLCINVPSQTLDNIVKSPQDTISLRETDMVAIKDCLSPTSIQAPWESKENSPSESSFASLSTTLDEHRLGG